MKQPNYWQDIIKIAEACGFTERGGGPEGIYYECLDPGHPCKDEIYATELVDQILIYLRWKGIKTELQQLNDLLT